MAIVAQAEVPLRDASPGRPGGGWIWGPFTQNNTDSDPIAWSFATDKSIQVYGTFDSAHIKIYGSNKSEPGAGITDWFQLTDPLGNAIDFTAAGGKQIAENTRWIKPVANGGGAACAVYAALHATRGK